MPDFGDFLTFVQGLHYFLACMDKGWIRRGWGGVGGGKG